MNAAFSGLLPGGIGFSYSWMAVSLLEFVSELPFGLFFGVIGDHGRRYTIVLEYKGQGHEHSLCASSGEHVPNQKM